MSPTHRSYDIDSLADPDTDGQRVELLVECDEHPGLHGRGQSVQQIVGLAYKT